MKYNYLILLFLIHIKLFSQKVEVEYLVSENTNDPILATSLTYKLLLNNNQSIYFSDNDSLNQFKYEKIIFDVKKVGELTQVKLSDNHYAFVKQDYFYKNFSKDTLIYNEIILNKKVIVGEKINIFNWEILPNSDTLVLNFKCQKAITTFRGRKYEAIFSNEIASNGGPWKFDGLPGLIISVKSLDNYFIIEPKKIILNSTKDENFSIVNIYENQSIISWNTFKITITKKLQEQLKKLKSLSEDGEGGSIKVTDKIEDLEIPEMKF